MSNELVVPSKENALEVYQKQNGLDPFLEQIKKEIDSFVPDVTTKKGRDAIASMAYKVAKSKTALDDVGKELVADLRLVPDLAGRVLDTEAEVEKVAHALKDIKDCLYLGRGINMPIAYEGALKLKEISYIHAEGYPAGEMKHGPIALIDKEMPVLCIAPKDPWHEKMISQIQQAKARDGIVIAVATEGDELVKGMADHVLWIPEAPWMLSPILTVLPLQLLAYHIAAIRGLDVDQPRNLAKSVTVE